MRAVENEKGKWKVGSVGKALSILNCFDLHRQEITLAQISQELDIPKSTAFNLIKTLEKEQYLRKSKNSQSYLPGVRLLELGYSSRNSIPVIANSVPLLENITRSTGEIAYLSTAHGDNLLVLEGTYPDRRFATYTTGGKALPLHTCSAGKMILSTLPDHVIEEYASRGLKQSTPNTIVSLDALMEEVNRIRQCGYSVDNEEESMGVRCVSVAVYGNTRRAVGTVSISGSVRSITDELVQEALPTMEKVAQVLSRDYYSFPVIYPDEQGEEKESQ